MERPHRATAQRSGPLLLAQPQPRRPGNLPLRGLRFNFRRRETGRPRSPNPAQRTHISPSWQLLRERSRRLRCLRTRRRKADRPHPRLAISRRRIKRNAAARSGFREWRIVDPSSPGNLRPNRHCRPPHRGCPTRRPPRFESRITERLQCVCPPDVSTFSTDFNHAVVVARGFNRGKNQTISSGL
jgi:hypothetical protein